MQLSRIVEIGHLNSSDTQVMVLDKNMPDNDISMLINEFEYSKSMIDESIRIYRNLALIISLAKKDEQMSSEWRLFLEKHFPKKAVASKLDNVFVNKGYNKLLLITNRRLLSVDIKKLNEKITRLNQDILYYNESLGRETRTQPAQEKRKFIDIIRGIFR